MSLLAYHVGRLTHLEVSMRRSLDQLRALAVTDPAAADAMHTVRAAASQIELVWLPLVRRVLATDPLSREVRRSAGLGELDQSLVTVMVDGYGWAAQHDMLADDATVVTLEEASALAARLNDRTLDVDDPEQLEWLAQRLAIIGRDPQLSAAFLANFHDWAELCDRLAGQRALLLSGQPFSSSTTVSEIDGVFAGLGRALQHDLTADACPTPDSVLPEMDSMQPYSAALVVRHLGLDGALLGQVTERLLRRWLDAPRQRHFEEAPTDFHLDGPNTADLMMPLLLADAVAGRWFVAAAALRPDLLVATADDAAAVQQLILTATDPALVSATDAAAVIVSIIDHVADGNPLTADGAERGRAWDLFLVDLIAPWTLQFSPLDEQFRLPPERKAQLLGFVIDDAVALDRLVAATTTVQAGVLTSLSNGSTRTLEEFASYIGLLGGLVVNELVGDEARALAAFEMLIGVAGLATALIPGVPMVAGIAMGTGLELMGAFAPFDPQRVASDARYAQEYSLTVTAAAVVATVARRLVDDGVLVVGSTAPPVPDPDTDHPAHEFMLALGRWLEQLPGGLDGDAAKEIRLHTYMVLNHERAAEFLSE